MKLPHIDTTTVVSAAIIVGCMNRADRKAVEKSYKQAFDPAAHERMMSSQPPEGAMLFLVRFVFVGLPLLGLLSAAVAAYVFLF